MSSAAEKDQTRHGDDKRTESQCQRWLKLLNVITGNGRPSSGDAPKSPRHTPLTSQNLREWASKPAAVRRSAMVLALAPLSISCFDGIARQNAQGERYQCCRHQITNVEMHSRIRLNPYSLSLLKRNQP
jgi:hypothetical protein